MKPNELQMSYMKQAAPSNHSDSIHTTLQNNPPDIQSAHYTIAPLKNELVHVDLLEGTHSSRYGGGMGNGGYLSRSQRSDSRSAHSIPTHSIQRNLPPPPPLPPQLPTQGSSNSSSSSILSDYRRIDATLNGRVSPHITKPPLARFQINEPYNSARYCEVESESSMGTSNSHQSRHSSQPHYYDITDFKPLYPDSRPLYTVQKNNGVYRQLDNSYLQTSGNFYSQEYAALSPVNEV